MEYAIIDKELIHIDYHMTLILQDFLAKFSKGRKMSVLVMNWG